MCNKGLVGHIKQVMEGLPDADPLPAVDLITKLECIALAGLCKMFQIVETCVSNSELDLDLGEIGQNGLEYDYSSTPTFFGEHSSEVRRAIQLGNKAEMALDQLSTKLNNKKLVIHFEDCQYLLILQY